MCTVTVPFPLLKNVIIKYKQMTEDVDRELFEKNVKVKELSDENEKQHKMIITLKKGLDKAINLFISYGFCFCFGFGCQTSLF